MSPLYVKDRRDLEHQVVTMQAQGWSIRSLARHFGLGRNTVRPHSSPERGPAGTGARASGHARENNFASQQAGSIYALDPTAFGEIPRHHRRANV